MRKRLEAPEGRQYSAPHAPLTRPPGPSTCRDSPFRCDKDTTTPLPADTSAYSVKVFRAEMDQDDGATADLCHITIILSHTNFDSPARDRPSRGQRGQDPPDLAPGRQIRGRRSRDPLSPGAETYRSCVTSDPETALYQPVSPSLPEPVLGTTTAAHPPNTYRHRSLLQAPVSLRLVPHLATVEHHGTQETPSHRDCKTRQSTVLGQAAPDYQRRVRPDGLERGMESGTPHPRDRPRPRETEIHGP